MTRVAACHAPPIMTLSLPPPSLPSPSPFCPLAIPPPPLSASLSPLLLPPSLPRGPSMSLGPGSPRNGASPAGHGGRRWCWSRAAGNVAVSSAGARLPAHAAAHRGGSSCDLAVSYPPLLPRVLLPLLVSSCSFSSSHTPPSPYVHTAGAATPHPPPPSRCCRAAASSAASPSASRPSYISAVSSRRPPPMSLTSSPPIQPVAVGGRG